MFVPILTLDYLSNFPWYLGPSLQILGFVCLLVTRYTASLYPRIGKSYYLASSILRLLGIFLITWAWLEILSNEPKYFSKLNLRGYYIYFLLFEIIILSGFSLYDSILRRFLVVLFLFHLLSSSALNIISLLHLLSHSRSFSVLHYFRSLSLLSFVFYPSHMLHFRADYPFEGFAILFIAFIWSIWSILELGLRRSVLYTKMDDSLIRTGPYRYQRHPQLFSALIIIIMSIFSLIPPHHDDLIGVFPYRLLNLLIAVVAVIIIVHSEEKDLISRLGMQYTEYKRRVPSMLSLQSRTPALSWFIVSSLMIWGYIFSLLTFILLFRTEK